MKRLFWCLLGFILYPAVFMPMLVKFLPDHLMEAWIHIYAEYLRMWGI